MNFFKKLFSSGKKAAPPETNEAGAAFSGIYSTAGFDKRYTADTIQPDMLDGCLKMVESYFPDNKLERKVAVPVNHPDNLDQVIDEGFGFALYCKSFQLGDAETTMFLAYAFSDYLIKTYSFTLYTDNEPEVPLRSMTLKYDKDGVVLSVYPFEYALKVLDYESTFVSLTDKIKAQLESLPSVNDVIKKFINSEDEEKEV